MFLRLFQALPSHLQTPPLSLRINQVMAAKESNSFPLPDTPAHPQPPVLGGFCVNLLGLQAYSTMPNTKIVFLKILS